ncbi:MAG: imidazole glycerol phosphate synthase subunit HisH [Gammaproteobacteria bacterium]|nr:imidazole glycerol phosphate synthase subunit HisH [Gammaproteobacteria bacterium]
MATIAVIDYGGSNLRSVAKAIETVAESRDRVIVADNAHQIRAADRIVFPGQGAIGNCMARLQEHDLVDVIRETARTRPFLGICLGLQSLMSTSNEDGGTACLDLFPGSVARFPDDPPPAADGSPQKVPHMGWNEVSWTHAHPVTANIPSGTRFYFVHSYYVVPTQTSLTIGQTTYIETFTSAIAQDYVFATQFHPEKSAAAGLQLLRNFLGWGV